MEAFFSNAQGNLLVRLLLAHILADFVLQTDAMVKNKAWRSRHMLMHIFLVFSTTWVFSGLWLVSLMIAILHWVIDSIKVILQKKYPQKQTTFFITDQVLHFLVIIPVWLWHYSLMDTLLVLLTEPFTNYKISLLLLGYAFVIWPGGYLLKFTLQNINSGNTEGKVEHGGKLIGWFERIIILTFVLLGQYEAIGFLVAGKGIIRFAGRDEHLRSEYVLVGTMMSYAISILTGVLITWLLSF